MGRRLYTRRDCSLASRLWSSRHRSRSVDTNHIGPSISPWHPEKHCVLIRIANKRPRFPCCGLSILYVRGLHPCGRYLRHPDELRDARDIGTSCCDRGRGVRDDSFGSRVGFASVIDGSCQSVHTSRRTPGFLRVSNNTLSFAFSSTFEPE